MANSEVRVAVVGMGRLGGRVADIVVERGYQLVAAVERPGPKIGQDAGEAHGGRHLGVAITDDLETALASHRPHIAVVVVADYLEHSRGVYEACLRAGTRVVSSGTELSFPWLSSGASAGQLDALARQTGTALLGSGNQDYLMIRSGRDLLGACVRAESLSYSRLLNVDAFGAETARTLGAGLTAEEIVARDEQRRRDGRPGIYEMISRQLAADVGLRVSSAERRLVPLIAAQDTFCRALDSVIRAGQPIGTTETIEIAAFHGLTIRFAVEARVFSDPGDRENIVWEVGGDPPLRLTIDQIDGDLTAAAQVVNRIPDVLDAHPGLMSIERMPPVRLPLD